MQFSDTGNVGCISYKEQKQTAPWRNSRGVRSVLAVAVSAVFSGVSEVSLPPVPPKDGHQGKTVVVSWI